MKLLQITNITNRQIRNMLPVRVPNDDVTNSLAVLSRENGELVAWEAGDYRDARYRRVQTMLRDVNKDNLKIKVVNYGEHLQELNTDESENARLPRGFRLGQWLPSNAMSNLLRQGEKFSSDSGEEHSEMDLSQSELQQQRDATTSAARLRELYDTMQVFTEWQAADISTEGGVRPASSVRPSWRAERISVEETLFDIQESS